jgi:hypothetical protein
MVRSIVYYCLNLNWVLEGNLELFPLLYGFGLYYIFLELIKQESKYEDSGNRMET